MKSKKVASALLASCFAIGVSASSELASAGAVTEIRCEDELKRSVSSLRAENQAALRESRARRARAMEVAKALVSLVPAEAVEETKVYWKTVHAIADQKQEIIDLQAELTLNQEVAATEGTVLDPAETSQIGSEIGKLKESVHELELTLETSKSKLARLNAELNAKHAQRLKSYIGCELNTLNRCVGRPTQDWTLAGFHLDHPEKQVSVSTGVGIKIGWREGFSFDSGTGEFRPEGDSARLMTDAELRRYALDHENLPVCSATILREGDPRVSAAKAPRDISEVISGGQAPAAATPAQGAYQ